MKSGPGIAQTLGIAKNTETIHAVHGMIQRLGTILGTHGTAMEVTEMDTKDEERAGRPAPVACAARKQMNDPENYLNPPEAATREPQRNNLDMVAFMAELQRAKRNTDPIFDSFLDILEGKR